MLKLRELRLQNNYTQDVLAKYLEVTRLTYTRYENGERELPLEALKKLSIFYNVSTDFILGLKEESEFDFDKLPEEAKIEILNYIHSLNKPK